MGNQSIITYLPIGKCDKMFFNRKNELKYLETKYNSSEPELLIFWGRRRIGKTFLLKQFCDKKQGIFLMATASTSLDNLECFSSEFADYFNDERLQIQPLRNWDEFFIYLDEKIQKRTLVVIDEYPYLIENNPAIPSIFQKYWDKILQSNLNIMLILNGSAISMMEKETLEYRSPLYGRRSGQWFLEAFDVISSNEFFEFKKLTQAIEAYAVTSGIPYYCKILSHQPDIYSAIKNKILSKGEVLFEEVDFLLRQEFRTPRSYFPILKAIAQGAHKFGEISSKTGYDKSNLTKYLSSLEKLKLIKREVPVTELKPEKSRKNLYFISDNFVNFWFTFVFPHLSELEFGKTDRIMKKFVIPNFNYYVSQKVEPIIIDLLKKDFFRLGLDFSMIGRYWDKNTEIDIWGETTDNRIIIGDIKWTETTCKKRVFLNLIEKANNMNINKDVIFLFISKSGFAKDFSALKDDKLILIDLSDWSLK